MLSIVVAIANDNVIGGDNKLLWHLPEDLKRFKSLTTTESKTLIMGRKTFESLPKILPGRKHIILTNNTNYTVDHEDVTVIHNVDALKPFIESDKEYFIIGGGQIYSALINYCTKMYITRIYESFEGDAYFPQWSHEHWELVEEIPGNDDAKYKFSYMNYVKKTG